MLVDVDLHKCFHQPITLSTQKDSSGHPSVRKWQILTELNVQDQSLAIDIHTQKLKVTPGVVRIRLVQQLIIRRNERQSYRCFRPRYLSNAYTYS